MAQGRSYVYVSWVMLFCMTACSFSRQPFDNVPQQGMARPAAQQPTYPYTPEQVPDTDPLAAEPAPVMGGGDKVKVGLLLPLSGPAEELGSAMRDAAILALFDKYASPTAEAAQATQIELIIRDTKNSPEGARQAAAEAVKEGARLLLGPVFAPTVQAIKPIAKTGKVSIISFSSDKSVAGDGVYVMGFDPQEQAARVAAYAFSNRINKIAAFAPANAYGKQVLDPVLQRARLMGKRVDPVISYAIDGSSLNEDMRTLAAGVTVGARLSIDGLFLPEAGGRLPDMLAMLAAQQITPRTVRFLGTGLWDDRDLLRKVDLRGAWLASSPPDRFQAFEQRFMSNYGYRPQRLASLAYDAVALAATMAQMQDGAFTREAITNPAGYRGPANGIFRFRRNGTIERGLAVVQVNQGELSVIEPAPTFFE